VQESEIGALALCLRQHSPLRGGMLNVTRDAPSAALERARAAGAVQLLVDALSERTGQPAAAAARGLAALARVSARARDDAAQAGAVRELVLVPPGPGRAALAARRQGAALRRPCQTPLYKPLCQQRECTVGTWVGATVGRGGGRQTPRPSAPP
jgi:hypothetical protein